jgi:hypothetical protein
MQRWRVVSVIGPALCALLFSALYAMAENGATGGVSGFPLDDSYIHAQFARQLAHGEGMSYQGGPWLLASTSPLWTALLSVVAGQVWWAKLLGVILFLCTVVLAGKLARDLGASEGWSALVSFAVASTSWLVWSALSGMEVLLFASLSLGALRRDLTESAPTQPGSGSPLPLAWVLAALAALARPEGAVLLGIVGASAIVRRRTRLAGDGRRIVSGVFATLVLLAPFALLAVARGGSILPTTLAVKTASFGGADAPLLQVLHQSLGVAFKPLPLAVVFAGAGVVVALGRRGGALVVWAVALPFCYALLSHGPAPLLGNFGRYLFPWLPVVTVLGVLGLESLARALGDALPSTGRRPGMWIGVGLAAALLVPSVLGSWTGRSFYARNVADVQASDVAAARWLAERVDPRALVAVQDIGAIGFFAPQRLLDLSGIVDPDVVHAVRAAASAADPWGSEGMRRVLESRRPDLVVTFDGWYPSLAAAMTPVARLDNPTNVTMGGGRVIVARPPWSRLPLAAFPDAPRVDDPETPVR